MRKETDQRGVAASPACDGNPVRYPRAPGGNHLYLRFAYEEGELKIGQLPT